MGKIDWNTLCENMQDHADSAILTDGKQDTYWTSRSFTACIMGDHKVSVLFRFIGYDSDEGLSQTSDSETRVAVFALFFIVQAEDDEAADILVNDAIMDFDYYMAYPIQGAPIYGNELIEWAKVKSVRKNPSDSSGIFGRMEITVRILEA